MARLPFIDAITNAVSAPTSESRATLPHAASMVTMESVSVRFWIRAGDPVHGWNCRTMSKSAASTKKVVDLICAPAASVHSGFKICYSGCGSTSTFHLPRLSSVVAPNALSVEHSTRVAFIDPRVRDSLRLGIWHWRV